MVGYIVGIITTAISLLVITVISKYYSSRTADTMKDDFYLYLAYN
jgi:hypothetical protein